MDIIFKNSLRRILILYNNNKILNYDKLFSAYGKNDSCFKNYFRTYMITNEMHYFSPIEKAISMGMDKSAAVWLVSMTGITNTFGRVICGWISSYESVDPILVNNVSLTFGGLYTVILPLLPYSMISYYVYASLFGFSMGKHDILFNVILYRYIVCIENVSTTFFTRTLYLMFSKILYIILACFASLRSTMIVELTGLELLTNAFGVLLMFQGVAAAVGSPLLGKYQKFLINTY